MSESAFSPFGDREFGSVFDGSPFYTGVWGYDELGNALARFNGKCGLAQVDEQHTDVSSVICIDGTRGIQHRDAMLVCKATARSYLGFMARRQFNVEPRGHQAAFPRLQNDRTGQVGAQIQTRAQRGGILGKLRVSHMDHSDA